MADPFRNTRGKQGRDTADSLEIQRIVALPIVELPAPEEIEAFCREEVDAHYFEDGFRLFATQVGAVLAWDLYDGLFAPIGVGWGKTLITLMIANRAYTVSQCDKSVLFVPSQVYEQLTKNDIPWARKRVGLRVPFHFMGGLSQDHRRRLAGSGKRGCYIMPYTLLSTTDAEALISGDMHEPPPNKRGIEGIQPNLIILDEAHNVKNPKAARTERLRRFIRARRPKLCALSGTITSKSINDYHYQLAQALGVNCALPMSESLTASWSFVLDPEQPNQIRGAGSQSKTGPLRPLVDWARRNFPREEIPSGVPGFRKAFKLRLTSAPGVVATGDADIGVSLVVENRPVPEFKSAVGYSDMKKFMDEVEDLWRTPSGDEIQHGFHKWRYLYELTSGFYYKLRWPTLAELARTGLNEDEARVYLDEAQHHHAKQQKYHKLLRRWIEHRGYPRLDTPLLIGSNMAQHGARDVGPELYEQWREMKDLEFDGMPERISEPVRICDYKLKHALTWAIEQQARKRGNRGGLIWYHHDEVGVWLDELLRATDLDFMWCPSESHRKGMNNAILDPRNKDKIVVASMGGHGTGKNLQFHENQLFIQWPRKADLAEQVLGRTHRNGQQADELLPAMMNTLDFDHQNLWACLIDALYIHQTTGSRQKLIYCGWNPMPRRFPIDFLRERGFADVPKLDPELRASLEERFGALPC